jgi:hypothetical protein
LLDTASRNHIRGCEDPSAGWLAGEWKNSFLHLSAWLRRPCVVGGFFTQQSQFFGTPCRDSQGGSVIGLLVAVCPPACCWAKEMGDGMGWLVPRIGKQNRRYTVSIPGWMKKQAPGHSLAPPSLSLQALHFDRCTVYGCTVLAETGPESPAGAWLCRCDERKKEKK